MTYLQIIFFLSSIVFNVNSEDASSHRVRRFAPSKDSKLAFDFNLLMPIPILGSMDVLGIVEIPVTVTMTNDTFSWTPISLPYLVMSPTAPIQSTHPFLNSFSPSDEFSLNNFVNPNHNYFRVHHIVKREASSMASRHRIDMLSGIAASLDQLGIDGSGCINKFICQLTHSPLIIESPLHEILEHVLSISKGSMEEELGENYVTFLEADKVGRMKGNCTQVYQTCPFDIFEMVEQ